MRYWSGLYQEGTQKAISDGVDLMLRTVIKLLGKQGEGKKTQLMIDASESNDNPDGGISSSLVKFYLSVCVLAALLILF
jgi:hypothetical protein